MAKTVVALIVLFALSFSNSPPAIAAPSAAKKDIYSTADTYSLTLDSGILFYSGTGEHISAPLYGLKFGYDAPGKGILDSFGTEGSLSYFSSSSNTRGGSTTGYLFRIDEVLPFTPGERLVPFVAAGIGGIITSTDTSTKGLPLFNYGAGLKYIVGKNFSVRADVRHILALTINGIDNFEFTVGLSYYFGKDKKKPEPVPDAKKAEEAQKALEKNGKSKEQKERELREKEQKEEEQREKERAERDKEQLKQDKLLRERLQKEWDVFEAQQREKPAAVKKPLVAPAQTAPAEQIAGLPVPEPIAATPAPAASAKPEIIRPAPEKAAEGLVPAATLKKAATKRAGAPTTEAQTAAESAPAVTLPSAAAAPVMGEAEPPAKARAIPPAKTAAAAPAKAAGAAPPAKAAAAAAPTEIAAIPAPAGKMAPEKAAAPPAPTTVATAKKPGPATVKEPEIKVAAPGAPSPLPATAGVPAPATPPGAAAKSAPSVTLPSAAAAAPAIREAIPPAKTAAAIPPAKTAEAAPAKAAGTAPPAKAAAAAAPTEIAAIPAPAGKMAPGKAAAPPVPSVQAAPPAPVEAAPAPTTVATAKKPGAATVKEPEIKVAAPGAPSPLPATAGIAAPATPPGVAAKSAPAVSPPSAAAAPASGKAVAELKDYYTLIAGDTINSKKIEPTLNKLKAAGQQPIVRKGIRNMVIYPLISECFTSRDAAIKHKDKLSSVVKDAFITREGASYCVVAGSFQTEDAALQEQKRLADKGFPVKIVESRVSVPVWRINSGRYADLRLAEEAAKTLAEKGIKTTIEKVASSIAEPEVPRVVSELVIEFDFDRSVVRRRYLPHIKRIADLLKSNPGFTVVIEGHTDSIGTSNYNLKLSQRRSNSVKNALVRFGVAPKRVSAKGYGLTRPVADNMTSEGRRKNRRAITIVIVTN